MLLYRYGASNESIISPQNAQERIKLVVLARKFLQSQGKLFNKNNAYEYFHFDADDVGQPFDNVYKENVDYTKLSKRIERGDPGTIEEEKIHFVDCMFLASTITMKYGIQVIVIANSEYESSNNTSNNESSNNTWTILDKTGDSKFEMSSPSKGVKPEDYK